METLASIANFGSTLAAVIAVFVAYWSVRLSHRAMSEQELHNRLTLKPIPFLALADYEHCLRVKVTNDGSGPLIIKTVELSDSETVREDLISWMPAPPAGIYWKNFTSLLTDRAMRPGEGLILLELEGEADDHAFASFRDQCRVRLAKLKATIGYTDVYGTKFEPYFRPMDWFARDKGTRS